MSDSREQIRLLIDRINDGWLKGDHAKLPSVLNECFHEQAVIVGPNLQAFARGKEACVKSYTDFLQQAKVRECTLSEPEIHLVESTAIATSSWTMLYELNGQEYRESGHDVFAITRHEGRWLVIWRAMLPSAQQSPA